MKLEERIALLIEEIGRVAILMEPWDAPAPLGRAWCLWEIFHAQRSGAEFDVAMGREQRGAFEAALVADFDSIMMALSRVDAWNDRGVQIFHDKDVAACVQTLGDAGLLEGERWRELLSTLQCDAPAHAANVAGLEALM